MNPRISPWWATTILAGVLGYFVGGIVRSWWLSADLDPIRIPAAWRIPQLPGMGGLRLAMVNDVLHERFVTRGKTWYSVRNERSRAVIAAWHGEGSPPSAVLEAFDDLGVGLDKVGDDAEAERVLRRKAALIGVALPDRRPPVEVEVGPGDPQGNRPDPVMAWESTILKRVMERGPLSPEDHQRYTTLANLGTVLIHGALGAAMQGDATAATRVEQGLACLDAAVAINPAAHFGRENWQITAVEHLLQAGKDPAILLHYDLIGEPLAGTDEARNLRPITDRLRLFDWPPELDAGLSPDPGVVQRITRSTNRLFGPDWTADDVDAHLTFSSRLALRSKIPQLGFSPRWVAQVHPSRRVAAPFDEPLLGLLGMWTWGGGANPHFALAIATMCERIGQNHLAIDAYERCTELANRFHPDPALRQRLVDHCRARQDSLAEGIAPGDPKTWLDHARRRHRDELAWAEGRRAAAERAEQAALALGMEPELVPAGDGDPTPLASPTGTVDEEWVAAMQSFSSVDGMRIGVWAMAMTGWGWILVAWGMRRWGSRPPSDARS